MQDMLGQIVRKLVEFPVEKLGMLYDLLEKLAGPLGQQWWQDLAKFLRREPLFVVTDIRSEWSEFYRKYFRMSMDFSDVGIPDDPGSFDRVILIPKGLTLAVVIKAIRKCFPADVYIDNPDRDVTENIRKADCNYAIRCRDRVEADEELQNTSANQLKERGINNLTLLERLVYELKYYSETNEHLDVINVTLCAGSRHSDGHVPNVLWHPDSGKLHIYWCRPGSSGDSLRARQAVS